MNTSQINYALEQDLLTRKIFRGVFPSDKLPQTIEKYPCGSVAKTDPSNKPGTHWVAFYFPSEEQGEFFDSYGQPPNSYRKSFKNVLNKHSYDWKSNTHKLQSKWSNVCGQYCIFYLAHKARGFSMGKIIHFILTCSSRLITTVLITLSNVSVFYIYRKR